MIIKQQAQTMQKRQHFGTLSVQIHKLAFIHSFKSNYISALM